MGDYFKEHTTISVLKPTKDRLSELGKHKDNYDTILNRLIDFWIEQHEEKKKWLREQTIY